MIEAAFENGSNKVYTSSAYQYDRDQKLLITGANLPEFYEVHFSNQESGGISYACEGDETGVCIPDAFFQTGDYIYAWVCMSSAVGAMESSTVYEVIIPIIPRPAPLPVVLLPRNEESEEEIDYEINGENLVFHSGVNFGYLGESD